MIRVCGPIVERRWRVLIQLLLIWIRLIVARWIWQVRRHSEFVRLRTCTEDWSRMRKNPNRATIMHDTRCESSLSAYDISHVVREMTSVCVPTCSPWLVLFANHNHSETRIPHMGSCTLNRKLPIKRNTENDLNTHWCYLHRQPVKFLVRENFLTRKK